jgi:hypothetical protein
LPALQINDPASLFLNPWTRIEDIFGGITRVNGKIVAVAALQVHYFFDSSPQRHATNPDWVEVSLVLSLSLSLSLSHFSSIQAHMLSLNDWLTATTLHSGPAKL